MIPGRGGPLLMMVVSTLGLAVVGACTGPRNFLNENDTLRRRNLELSAQVKNLEADLAAAKAEIAARESSEPAELEGVKRSDLPRVTRLTFASLTGAIDTDSDGVADALRVYAKPLDQDGRLMVCVGEAVVQVVAIEPGREPATIMEKTWGPQAWRAAYRTGFTGTHYTLVLDIPATVASDGNAGSELTVKLTFIDAATGVAHTHQRPVDW